MAFTELPNFGAGLFSEVALDVLLFLELSAMRNEIWKLRSRIHYNCHYWSLVSSRIKRIEISIKLALGFGTVASLIAFTAFSELAFYATTVSFICAFISCVILPAIKWDDFPNKIENVHSDWLDQRKVIDGIWAEHEDGKTITRKSLQKVRDDISEIGKFSTYFSDITKFQKEAEKARDITLQG